ncbi:DeoR/GlpR family DNA-binding transcription regulator [Thermococcus sp. 2319x1]|uniref:DeoR/GlpR family DNA-binding transcription regulator n=1 Tax=Thermococcus sp. 2319x1 TaxID=1674923 RepID=UPI001581FD77|nr:DeoR/GlpR family DNA-binding transcription regulator [Thermococcus sp. 2319x1]
MFAEERRAKILELLRRHKSMTVSELAKILNVSEPTIRRDLAFLESKRQIIRTHGGAIAIEYLSYEPTFFEKESLEKSAKEEIGKLVNDLVKDEDIIVLDSGTTTLEIARNLEDKNITVITNSPLIVRELSMRKNVEVILTGGTLKKGTLALVGPIAENTLSKLHADMAFVGANGITLDAITTTNLLEAEIKRIMIKIASTSYIVADHSKFGRTAFVKFAEPNEISGIITDSGIDPKWITAFKERKIQLITPGGVGR